MGLGASLLAVGTATGAIFALRPIAPVLSLGAIYVLAVLVVAVGWGTVFAVLVSVASMLAFNWFFLPPTHTLRLRDTENWAALVVYLVIAIVVSGLATRARRRTAEAEQRRREASLLAEVSAILLEPGEVHAKVRRIEALAADVLSVGRVHVELESLRRPAAGEHAEPLLAGSRDVGRVFFERGVEPATEVTGRLFPALAALLAAATDRERLARKALEAETLRRSDMVKTAILRSVSHDLRSPLTAIRAAGDGLDNASLELDDLDRAELLATIRAATRRLDRLVSNLVDLARLEADAAQPRPELWTVDDLIARSLEAVGPDADRVCVVSASPEPSPTLVDARQIERVLVNLLENAVKFSPPDASVEIGVAQEGGEVVIRVSDSGPGLSERELERVFEPFERGGESLERKGSGLGLAIAKGFAQANRGRIWAESEPGRGASFMLALPAAERPVEARV
jgi:two-component system sensor histidine kinase KdpD